MQISIIAVGKIGNSSESELVNRYSNRFNKINKLIGLNLLQIIEVDEKKYRTRTQQVEKILNIVKAGSNVVIFDQKGKSVSSEYFTKYLINQRDRGVKKQVFIIGGAFGFCSSIYKEADDIFSLGEMIWPHALARVMITEQIYRSASIILGNPYHKN